MSVQSKIRSKMMGVMSSGGFASFQRTKARYLRLLRIESPKLYYFHQVEDPYSHLMAQKLSALQDKYDLPILAYVVGPTEDPYKGDPQKFATWLLQDAQAIADYFDTEFSGTRLLSQAEIDQANESLLDRMDKEDFADAALDVGKKLWGGEFSRDRTTSLSARAEAILNRNSKMLSRLGHYFGGSFYFEGEWYWGLDRIHLLEKRLQEEGFGTGALVCPRPQVSDFSVKASEDLVLEYFPSLRSPYTAIGHKRVLQMVSDTGIKLELRPVMPMMMRGIPAPRPKQFYIMSDSGRESRFYGDAFGPFCDPFGEPVKRAFAAYHHAVPNGRGMEFVTEYLDAAFAEGLDITVDEGLAEVCRRAGFDMKDVDFDADWFAVLEENLAAMAEGSLWGVPSFRITGGGDESFACWGQDRIWRVAAEIQSRSQESI